MDNTERYTTTQDVCQYLGIDVPSESSDEDHELDLMILAMSVYIDRQANRRIFRTEPTTILYDGDGSDLMVIEDVLDLELHPLEVLVGGVAVEVYQYPQRKEHTSRIVLGDGQRFTVGKQNVSVTGVHAMCSELPEDVKFACTVLVAGAYNAKLTAGKVGTTEQIGSYSVTYRTDKDKANFETAKKMISSYRRIAL